MKIVHSEDVCFLAAMNQATRRAGPCPDCGGPLDVALINVTQVSGPPSWIATDRAECRAECWRADPEGYLLRHGLTYKLGGI